MSDVDVGLVLRDPLESVDERVVASFSASVKAAGAPLSERLSVFWGSVVTLKGAGAGGRFPPVDRLDLIESGRLLSGWDVRGEVVRPTVREVVVAAAAQAMRSMTTPEAMDQIKNPESLIAAGVRPLTKRILFPVRFVLTARTGRIGRNDAAVEYFTGAEPGPLAELARKAFEWRYEPPRSDDPEVLECVNRGLLPLYRVFAGDYEARLRGYDETELAQAFADWHGRLG